MTQNVIGSAGPGLVSDVPVVDGTPFDLTPFLAEGWFAASDGIWGYVHDGYFRMVGIISWAPGGNTAEVSDIFTSLPAACCPAQVQDQYVMDVARGQFAWVSRAEPSTGRWWVLPRNSGDNAIAPISGHGFDLELSGYYWQVDPTAAVFDDYEALVPSLRPTGPGWAPSAPVSFGAHGLAVHMKGHPIVVENGVSGVNDLFDARVGDPDFEEHGVPARFESALSTWFTLPFPETPYRFEPGELSGYSELYGTYNTTGDLGVQWLSVFLAKGLFTSADEFSVSINGPYRHFMVFAGYDDLLVVRPSAWVGTWGSWVVFAGGSTFTVGLAVESGYVVDSGRAGEFGAMAPTPHTTEPAPDNSAQAVFGGTVDSLRLDLDVTPTPLDSPEVDSARTGSGVGAWLMGNWAGDAGGHASFFYVVSRDNGLDEFNHYVTEIWFHTEVDGASNDTKLSTGTGNAPVQRIYGWFEEATEPGKVHVRITATFSLTQFLETDVLVDEDYGVGVHANAYGSIAVVGPDGSGGAVTKFEAWESHAGDPPSYEGQTLGLDNLTYLLNQGDPTGFVGDGESGVVASSKPVVGSDGATAVST